MPSRRRDGHQHRRHARHPMTHATPSIPIFRRIQSSVLAALVTAAVMCIFPLLERFSENSPTPPLHSQPVPVKITSLPPSASVQTAPKTVPKQTTPRRQLAPVALPTAIVPPKPISHISRSWKPLLLLPCNFRLSLPRRKIHPRRQTTPCQQRQRRRTTRHHPKHNQAMPSPACPTGSRSSILPFH